jgi:hypothetical protein
MKTQIKKGQELLRQLKKRLKNKLNKINIWQKQ